MSSLQGAAKRRKLRRVVRSSSSSVEDCATKSLPELPSAGPVTPCLDPQKEGNSEGGVSPLVVDYSSLTRESSWADKREGVDPEIGRQEAARVVNAARQFLRSRNGDKLMEHRLRALARLSRGETLQFYSDNVARRPGHWIWTVVDERMVASENNDFPSHTCSSNVTDLGVVGNGDRRECFPKVSQASVVSGSGSSLLAATNHGANHPGSDSVSSWLRPPEERLVEASRQYTGVLPNDMPLNDIPLFNDIKLNDVALHRLDGLCQARLGGKGAVREGITPSATSVDLPTPAQAPQRLQHTDELTPQRPYSASIEHSPQQRAFAPKRPFAVRGREVAAATRWIPQSLSASASGPRGQDSIGRVRRTPISVAIGNFGAVATSKSMCRHPQQQLRKDAGCCIVCIDCGEVLRFDGWKMEVSAASDFPKIRKSSVMAELSGSRRPVCDAWGDVRDLSSAARFSLGGTHGNIGVQKYGSSGLMLVEAGVSAGRTWNG